MNEMVSYIPEDLRQVKRVWDRAMRCQLDPRGQPGQVYRTSSATLQALSPEELSLPRNLQNQLKSLIDQLRQNHWADDPLTGNDAIKRFYSDLNGEMRRLGLL